jgi:hypothetical protein
MTSRAPNGFLQTPVPFPSFFFFFLLGRAPPPPPPLSSPRHSGMFSQFFFDCVRTSTNVRCCHRSVPPTRLFTIFFSLRLDVHERSAPRRVRTGYIDESLAKVYMAELVVALAVPPFFFLLFFSHLFDIPFSSRPTMIRSYGQWTVTRTRVSRDPSLLVVHMFAFPSCPPMHSVDNACMPLVPPPPCTRLDNACTPPSKRSRTFTPTGAACLGDCAPRRQTRQCLVCVFFSQFFFFFQIYTVN